MVGGGGGGWVCKVILVFRFGPRLGLKTEDLGQAEQFNFLKKHRQFSNLILLGPPLHLEKFLCWAVVCKVILVFRFGQYLGLSGRLGPS